MDKFETTSISIAGAPTIEFRVHGDTCRAELAGATLYAEVCDQGADLRLTAADGEVLASLVVLPRAHRNLTENVTDVGAALLWSHWRYTQANSVDATP